MGNSFNILDYNGLVLAVEDRKGAADSGGIATPLAWTERELNTVTLNKIGSVLTGNSFSLPPGDYYARCLSPYFKVNRCRIRLSSNTNPYVILGANGWLHSSLSIQGTLCAEGRFILTVAADMTVEYYVQTGGAFAGELGNNTIDGNDTIFTTVQIWAN